MNLVIELILNLFFNTDYFNFVWKTVKILINKMTIWHNYHLINISFKIYVIFYKCLLYLILFFIIYIQTMIFLCLFIKIFLYSENHIKNHLKITYKNQVIIVSNYHLMFLNWKKLIPTLIILPKSWRLTVHKIKSTVSPSLFRRRRLLLLLLSGGTTTRLWRFPVLLIRLLFLLRLLLLLLLLWLLLLLVLLLLLLRLLLSMRRWLWIRWLRRLDCLLLDFRWWTRWRRVGWFHAASRRFDCYTLWKIKPSLFIFF